MVDSSSVREGSDDADVREECITPQPRASPAHPYSRVSFRRNRSGAFTISLANCAVEPGVENMLGHAPPPLAEIGLDMRGGHPAGYRSGSGRLSQDEVLKPRRLLRRKEELSCTTANRKPLARRASPHSAHDRLCYWSLPLPDRSFVASSAAIFADPHATKIVSSPQIVPTISGRPD